MLNINLFGQNQKLIVKNIDGWNTVLLVSDSKEVDTLWKHGYEVEFIDTFLSSQNTSYIIRTPNDIFFVSYIRLNGKWQHNNSGSLDADWNPNWPYISSAPIPERIKESRKKREYKIIGDDLVSIKVDGVETIKDCNDFRIEREAREREYQEWLKENGKTKQDTIPSIHPKFK